MAGQRIIEHDAKTWRVIDGDSHNPSISELFEGVDGVIVDGTLSLRYSLHLDGDAKLLARKIDCEGSIFLNGKADVRAYTISSSGIWVKDDAFLATKTLFTPSVSFVGTKSEDQKANSNYQYQGRVEAGQWFADSIYVRAGAAVIGETISPYSEWKKQQLDANNPADLTNERYFKDEAPVTLGPKLYNNGLVNATIKGFRVLGNAPKKTVRDRVDTWDGLPLIGSDRNSERTLTQ